MAETALARHVDTVRRFNRFYTRKIGVLQEHVLKSPFSLTEARVLYELAHHDDTTASVLGEDLELDAGYLSRILRGFSRRGLIERKPSPADARQSLLRLTARGQEAFARLNAASHEGIGALLRSLSEEERERVVTAMHTVETLLGAQPERQAPYLLRPHRPGDLGWVVHRHGVLYADEYGYDEQFEALVADIVARFIRRFNPKRERCWIAEKDGENVGSVFLVQRSKTVAQLRLLLVEPRARGLGIGKRLVSECVRFARQVGYSTMTLWTQSDLHAARHIYEAAGFRLGREQPHHSFGHDLIAQTWNLRL